MGRKDIKNADDMNVSRVPAGETWSLLLFWAAFTEVVVESVP